MTNIEYGFAAAGLVIVGAGMAKLYKLATAWWDKNFLPRGFSKDDQKFFEEMEKNRDARAKALGIGKYKKMPEKDNLTL